MMQLLADMHIHTALSPCAERDMSPPAIAREARRKGLGVIAVCDHNTCGNAAAVGRAAAGDPLVIPGMEITTVEEVHVLGLFPDAGAAQAAAAAVRDGLPPWKAFTAWGAPDMERRPAQELMDADGAVTGIEERMLASASGLDLTQAISLIREHGGLAIAAHVDRRSFSVFGQLGFLPPDARFDALEISAAGAARGRAAAFTCHGIPLVSSSDSHFLSDIGAGCTLLEVEEPCFAEIARALCGAGGRRCAIA
jgi:3',5'-nucleoside bisphosphate phosphatase